jgi:NAD-dependent SIR2 family protein deacetylase
MAMIPEIARILLQPSAKISFLTGAGVSVAAGIPDFRSPGGMYDTLQPDLLTATPEHRRLMAMDPTYVVSWDIFRHTQFPYLEVRRPFILGINSSPPQWAPTITHFFPALLHRKQKLLRLYTQNIDGLDYQCGIPKDKIIAVHGSIGSVSCEGCNTLMPTDEFIAKVRSHIKDIYGVDGTAPEKSTPILCRSCNRPLVKPATVLYGRNLPREFFDCSDADAGETSMLFVAGTSLTVHPAASLPDKLPATTPKIVVNRDRVGNFDYVNDASATFLQGDCDSVFLQIIDECGWLREFSDLYSGLLCESSKLLLEDRLEVQGGGRVEKGTKLNEAEAGKEV